MLNATSTPIRGLMPTQEPFLYSEVRHALARPHLSILVAQSAQVIPPHLAS